MKKLRISLPTMLMTVLQTVLISVPGLMCLSQAYSLELPLYPTVLVCTGLSVLFLLCALPRRSWPFTMTAAIVFLAVLIWQRIPLEESLGYVLYRITYEFSLCYDNVRVVGLESGTAAWILWVLAVPLTWVPVWICSREGSAALVALTYAPILILVLTIVDLAPVFWLILLTGGLLLLLLTQYVRERSPEEGSRLARWLLLPTFILVSAITVLWPPADYERAQWAETLREAAETRGELETTLQEVVLPELLPPKGTWSRELRTVDLSREGPKTMTGLPVLDYTADTNLTKLRGTALAVYENNTWKALDPDRYEAQHFEQTPLLSAAEGSHVLQVRTQSAEPLLYTAYAMTAIPTGGLPVDDAYIKNDQRLREYAVSYEEGVLSRLPVGYDAFVQEEYLQIPEELREPLAELARREGLSSVQTVADFVQQAGVYDLLTPRVPDGKDFVLYFLQESHRGYCVHFASAAVLLLRTVGVPARYVTGYSVSGQAGQWQTVTQDDAHAWAEYYQPTYGWLPLDPTPMALEAGTEPVPAPEITPVPDQEIPPQPELAPQAPDRTEADTPEEAAGSHPMLLLLILPGLAAVLVLRRLLVCRHRQDRCTRARPNRRALTYWRWLVQLCRVRSRHPEEELLCLAEKARFSQHTLTEEEIGCLRRAVEQQIEELRGESLLRRLWYQYGLNLY